MVLAESNHSNLSNWETKIILLISIFSLLKAIEIYVGISRQLLSILRGPPFNCFYISFSLLHFPLLSSFLKCASFCLVLFLVQHMVFFVS